MPSKTILAAAALLSLSLSVHATTLSVDAVDNIYGAGHSTPPNPGTGSAGELPPGVTFAAEPGQVLTFSSVTGMSTLTTAFGEFPPDGNPSYPMDMSSFGGISGIVSDASSYLVGVFLGSTEPTDPAPSILNFTSLGLGTAFPTLSPVIGQMFFIGDGLTGNGTGSEQQFEVPADATRLYLGFPDGYGYMGLPGAFQDNDGTLVATFTIVPEPGSLGWLAAGGAVFLWQRRRQQVRTRGRSVPARCEA